MIVFALFALSTKVDVAFTLIAIFVTLVLSKAVPPRSTTLSYCVIGLGIILFVVNMGIVIPHFKEESCRLLGVHGDFTVNHASVSGWFHRFFSGFYKWSFYSEVFGKKEVLRYLLITLWPLIFVVYRVPWICCSVIPAVMINIVSNTGYLVQGYFHYDHSSYAVIALALVLGLRKSKHPTIICSLLLMASLLHHWILPNDFRLRLTSGLNPKFWVIEEVPEVRALEVINRTLPRDGVLSADYTTSSYLLEDRNNVFMFPNPFKSTYFGIYETCTEYLAAPNVDMIVLRRGYQVTKDEQRLFIDKRGFENVSTTLPLTFYIRKDSSEHDLLVAGLKFAEDQLKTNQGGS